MVLILSSVCRYFYIFWYFNTPLNCNCYWCENVTPDGLWKSKWEHPFTSVSLWILSEYVQLFSQCDDGSGLLGVGHVQCKVFLSLNLANHSVSSTAGSFFSKWRFKNVGCSQFLPRSWCVYISHYSAVTTINTLLENGVILSTVTKHWVPGGMKSETVASIRGLLFL